MCGIFGYVGCPVQEVDVPGMTLAALKRLEYRGYDSWGIAVRHGVGIEVEKHVGKIGQAVTTLPESTIGFGHTRWATHGGVTEPNAHPHQDESGRVALIHNGIVENYITLKAGLIARGHTFRSGTDTEVIVHLVEEALVHGDNPDADLTWAVRHAFRQLDGLNAVIAMVVDRQELVAVKNVSPLIVGLSDEATYIASDVVVPLTAGPEQCVLSTKAYTAKVATLLLTAYAMAGKLEEGQQLLKRAAIAVEQALHGECAETVRQIAERIVDKQHLYVIGRGLAYPTALESALKIKEVSYMHAEGFAGGELKHGVIALLEEDTPCLVFAPMDETRADVLSGAMEMRARGGFIIGVSPEPDEAFHVHIPVADIGDASPLVNVIPAQLLGYHLAKLRGYDPDKPRNLAKSVTVK